MSERLRRVADLALVYPQMVRAEAVHEIVVERNFGFQILDALPQFGLVTGEKNRICQTEIDLRHFVAIRTKGGFYCYIHNFISVRYFMVYRA